MAGNVSNNERFIRVVNEHWIKYVVPTMVYALLTGISVLLFLLASLSVHHYMWLSHTVFLSGLFLLLISHHWFFAVLMSEAADCIIITNKRVISFKIRLLLHDEMFDISYDKMKTVESHKNGLLQNILRYGTLHFEGTKAKIPLIPHPNSVARDIESQIGLR